MPYDSTDNKQKPLGEAFQKNDMLLASTFINYFYFFIGGINGPVFGLHRNNRLIAKKWA